MPNIAYINGKFIKFNKATVHIEDRGLQFADSVYEVIAIINKKLIDTEYHLKRLKFSLRELNLKISFNKNELLKIFQNLIIKNNIFNGIIYFQITRGVQSREHVYNKNLKPTVIIYSRNKKFNLPGKNFKAVKTITYQDLRWVRKDIKTVNLLPNILAANVAFKKNAYEAILIKDGNVTEGTSSNIWIITKNKLITHPCNQDILKGITRTRLKLIIKNLDLKMIEKKFSKNQLYKADEAFLTSSGSFITPISKVDAKLINGGKIGRLTEVLAKSYYKLFNNE